MCLSHISCIAFCQVDRLKAELMYERRTSEEHLSRFEDERRVWQEEKEKVKTGNKPCLSVSPSAVRLAGLRNKF